MKVRHEINSANALILGAIVSVLISGCGVKNPAVIAGTGTVLGVDISQNQTSQTPQFKLGYTSIM